MRFNDVVECNARDRPSLVAVASRRGRGTRGLLGWLIRFRLVLSADSPAKGSPDIVAMVATAGLLGLISECALIDADVLFVAQMRFDNVVQGDAGSRPLRAGASVQQTHYAKTHCDRND